MFAVVDPAEKSPSRNRLFIISTIITLFSSLFLLYLLLSPLLLNYSFCFACSGLITLFT